MDHVCGYDQHLAFLCVSSYSLRASSHPAVQNSRRYVKVSDYFSDMVIQAHSTVDKPGMNFEFTYFDNPKSNLPSSCVNWLTQVRTKFFFWGGGGQFPINSIIHEKAFGIVTLDPYIPKR